MSIGLTFLLMYFFGILCLMAIEGIKVSRRENKYREFNKKIKGKNDSEYVKSLKRKMK
tara:strand:- start:642 stop:815 length:174 start_codon:yes stop_codon:yes gene_type:complete